MNRLKQMVAAALLLACAVRAHAVNNIMFDVDYNWQVGASSFTSVTSKTVAFNPFLPVAGYFIGGSTPNVVGYSFQFLPVGSSGTFSISQTTATFSPLAQNTTGYTSLPAPRTLDNINQVPIISTSTNITVPAGTTLHDAYSDTFRAKTENPVFNFTSLNPAATYYLYWTMGVQRR
jgi:hypothetical protein